jgi:hypothetical protein
MAALEETGSCCAFIVFNFYHSFTTVSWLERALFSIFLVDHLIEKFTISWPFHQRDGDWCAWQSKPFLHLLTFWEGGYINLINGSPYDWSLLGAHSYQMTGWKWPQIVPAGKTSCDTLIQPLLSNKGQLTTVYVEWAEGLWVKEKDDAGEVAYGLRGRTEDFSLHFSNHNGRLTGFDVKAILDDIQTQNNPRGSVIEVGFEHDRSRNFILSGDGDNFASSNPPSDWMHQNLKTLGNRKLRHICMPGSHDAGMSKLGKSTVGAVTTNTLTQDLNVREQLEYGSRFLDIRPVISDGQFTTGHYSEVAGLWHGGNGQTIAEIIDNINQ